MHPCRGGVVAIDSTGSARQGGGEGERKEVNLSLRGMASGQGAAGLAIDIRKFS